MIKKGHFFGLKVQNSLIGSSISGTIFNPTNIQLQGRKTDDKNKNTDSKLLDDQARVVITCKRSLALANYLISLRRRLSFTVLQVFRPWRA